MVRIDDCLFHIRVNALLKLKSCCLHEYMKVGIICTVEIVRNCFYVVLWVFKVPLFIVSTYNVLVIT